VPEGLDPDPLVDRMLITVVIQLVFSGVTDVTSTKRLASRGNPVRLVVVRGGEAPPTERHSMNYEEAVELQADIARGDLPRILHTYGVDIFLSDRTNAAIREAHGDTPYCAPDVDPALGHCGGGDAWPQCCEGHKFITRVEMVIEDHENHRGGPTGETCHWMIEVASGNPEPDSYADTIKIVDCGAPLTRFVRNGSAGWECENGHNGWEYGSAECEYQMMEEEYYDRRYGG